MITEETSEATTLRWLRCASSETIRLHQRTWMQWGGTPYAHFVSPYPFDELIAAAEAREAVQHATDLAVELAEREAMYQL